MVSGAVQAAHKSSSGPAAASHPVASAATAASTAALRTAPAAVSGASAPVRASSAQSVAPASVASAASSAASASSASSAVPASSAAVPATAAPAASSAAVPATAAPAASSAAVPATSASAPGPAPLTLPEHPKLTAAQAAAQTRHALAVRQTFARDVKRRLRVPLADQRAYGQRLQAALDEKNLGALAGEFVILVDRAVTVQTLFIYFRAMPGEPWQMIGASPVATGRPGEFDHFLTPLGVFEHTPSNMDFRAEGTMNDNGIRGYGARDMRIYDFGWVDGERGWGKGGRSPMRFQMHATDPDRLEPLLGIRHSKGCVRIPASLNAFIDHYGIIDAEYQALVDSGKSLWVLHPNREVTPWAGRFIVVIDSERKTRPAWAPVPGSKARAKVPKGGDTAD
ncbi:L,D-transpeptidase [Paraburkholderia silviterrae]|uniref:L,D-transpeptidase n=1 Tax=Paraburkholderia silviterrae TaxID=2528715 RepID=UPI001F0D1C8E|nr:L,D-transpeptidase [Paraburkholderia silviterrae]